MMLWQPPAPRGRRPDSDVQRGPRDWTVVWKWLHVSEYEDVAVTNLFCATRQQVIALAACHSEGPRGDGPCET